MSTHETPHLAQTVGLNIRRARKAAGLTQQQLAEMIGAKGGAKDVSRWENGGVEIGPKYRPLVANVLFDGDVSLLYQRQERAAA